jgi:hypothetical protein
MGLQVKGFLGGYQDGSLDVNPLTGAYVAGQPLKVNTSGQLELCYCYAEGTDCGYCGLAKGFSGSTSLQKSDLYNGKATYIAGFNKLTLDEASAVDGSDHRPFDTTLTYNEGDDLYIDENGLLSNNGAGAHAGYATVCANATPIAYVVEVGTSQAYMVINQVR